MILEMSFYFCLSFKQKNLLYILNFLNKIVKNYFYKNDKIIVKKKLSE